MRPHAAQIILHASRQLYIGLSPWPKVREYGVIGPLCSLNLQSPHVRRDFSFHNRDVCERARGEFFSMHIRGIGGTVTAQIVDDI